MEIENFTRVQADQTLEHKHFPRPINGSQKNEIISMAREKRLEKDVGLKLSEDVTIEDLSDRLYKFLGIEEAEQHENKVVLKKAEKELIRRVSVILDTPMSDQNNINAINTFALPVLTFFMPVIFFSQADLISMSSASY